VISTLLISCDTGVEALEKLNTRGKKILEAIINNFYEINTILEAKNKSSALKILLKNVRRLHLTSLIIQHQKYLEELEEIDKGVGLQVEVIAKNLENLNETFDKISSKFRAKCKGVPATLTVPELKSKAETLLLVTILLNDLSAELIKDRRLKSTIISEIRYYYQLISEGKALNSTAFDSIKYCLQLWIHRPYVTDDTPKAFSDLVLELIQNREGFC
jgi:hypothetical protein